MIITIAAVAMQMGWDEPYGARFTVVTINVLSAALRAISDMRLGPWDNRIGVRL